MADIVSSLISHLLLDGTIAAMVGTRIYPEALPAGTSTSPTVMPAITVQLVDEPVKTTHDNQTLYKARIQVDAWGGSYKSSHSLADVLHEKLHGYRGVMGGHTVGGVFRQRKLDDPQLDIGLHRVIQDFMINYK